MQAQSPSEDPSDSPCSSAFGVVACLQFWLLSAWLRPVILLICTLVTCRGRQMLPVLHLPQHGRAHLHGLQQPLHVPESRAADHPKWTGEDCRRAGDVLPSWRPSLVESILICPGRHFPPCQGELCAFNYTSMLCSVHSAGASGPR